MVTDDLWSPAKIVTGEVTGDLLVTGEVLVNGELYSPVIFGHRLSLVTGEATGDLLVTGEVWSPVKLSVIVWSPVKFWSPMNFGYQ